MGAAKIDPRVLDALPCFAGTRVPIRMLFDHLGAGETLETFLRQYPTVSREQALAILAFPITVDSEVMGGTPCFAATRVPVQTLFDYLGHGRALAEFLDDFPSVRRQQAVSVVGLAGEYLLRSLPLHAPAAVSATR